MSHSATTSSAHAGQPGGAASRHGATEGAVTVTEDGRVLNDPTHRVAPGHGNTTGSWAMAIMVVVGFLVGSVGLLMDAMIVVWIGVGLVVLGALVGIVAGRAGGGDGHH